VTTSSSRSSHKAAKRGSPPAPKVAVEGKAAPVPRPGAAAPDAAPAVAAPAPMPDPVPAAMSAPAPAETSPAAAPAPAETSFAASENTMKGKPVMTDTIDTAKTYAEEAGARFQSAFSDVNDKTRTALDKSSRAFAEIGELTKGNVEAVVESSKIAAKGLEALGQNAAEFSRKSFEKTNATLKSFASVKSPAEFFQLQSELLSSTLDSFVSETSRNSETLLKLASEINQPISNRVSVVTEKLKAIAA